MKASKLTKEQMKELDFRLAKHKAGKIKYYTLDQLRIEVLKIMK